MKKLQLCSRSLCLPRFSTMMLAAIGNIYQLDLVERAMKIQIPDDEMCHHDERIGKYHSIFLRGSVNEDDAHLRQWTTRTILMLWPRQSKGRRSRSFGILGHSKQNTPWCVRETASGTDDRDRNESASSAAVHTGLHSVQRSKETRRKRKEKRELIRRTAKVPWPCTQKRACSQEKHWKQEGRWVTVVQPALWARVEHQTVWHVWMNNDTVQLVFPWITKKTWYTLANGKGQQSEGEVASKVNAGGRTERLQDPPRSVQSLAPICGPSLTSALVQAFSRNLTDQSFAQLETETNGHLSLSLVEEMLSQPIWDILNQDFLPPNRQVKKDMAILGSLMIGTRILLMILQVQLQEELLHVMARNIVHGWWRLLWICPTIQHTLFWSGLHTINRIKSGN